MRAQEKRERVYDEAALVLQMEVAAWNCCDCELSGRGAVPPAACREEGHAIQRRMMTRRNFKCRACGRYKETLDQRFPKGFCCRASCRSNDFEQCPFVQGPKVDPMDGVVCHEALLARGVEHGFSLRQD